MTTERERELLARCLRLEAEIVALKQERAESWPLPRFRREVQASDIEQMRALRQRGLGYNEIARRTGWSYPTVARSVRDVVMNGAAYAGARQPVDDEQIVQLHEMFGLSFQKIGAHMGISRFVAWKHYRRAAKGAEREVGAS